MGTIRASTLFPHLAPCEVKLFAKKTLILFETSDKMCKGRKTVCAQLETEFSEEYFSSLVKWKWDCSENGGDVFLVVFELKIK